MRERKPLTREAALLRMADLCARAEMCEWEVMQKLARLGLSSGTARGIVDELVERRFIDNARYAAALARDKVRFSGWGRRKIAAHLMSRRIPSPDIREALGSIDAGEYREALGRAARAKARSLDLTQREDRDRLMRHLAARGFEAGAVTGIVRELRCEEEEGE